MLLWRPAQIWDYESGEYEKTLKGHTNTVQDMAFDSKGTVLGDPRPDLTCSHLGIGFHPCAFSDALQSFDLRNISYHSVVLGGYDDPVVGFRGL